jgi:hypothetical protein
LIQLVLAIVLRPDSLQLTKPDLISLLALALL